MMNIKSILLLFFVFTYNCVMGQNTDIRLLREIHLNRNQSLDGSFRLITKSATPISIGFPLTLGAIGFFQKDSVLKKKALKAGISIATTMTISTLLKYTINRSRPYETYPDIKPLASDFTPSFPSGHTSSAFSTATTISLIYPKWYIIVPSYTWASAVAYSRLHMGMHYPTDILGGIIVGMGSAYLSYWLERRWFK